MISSGTRHGSSGVRMRPWSEENGRLIHLGFWTTEAMAHVGHLSDWHPGRPSSHVRGRVVGCCAVVWMPPLPVSKVVAPTQPHRLMDASRLMPDYCTLPCPSLSNPATFNAGSPTKTKIQCWKSCQPLLLSGHRRLYHEDRELVVKGRSLVSVIEINIVRGQRLKCC